MSIFSKDPLQIIVYKTYGTKNHLYIKGRALEDENIDLNKKGLWGILVNSWKRFESDEIKHAKLIITLPNQLKIETTTNKDGYFLIDETIDDISDFVDEEGWLPFTISYASTLKKREITNNNQFKGEILIPNKKANYGIISDIDDTILHTGVVSKLKWKLLFNTFFKSPKKRRALAGASDFYSILQKGSSEKRINPFFYVSHSPWNLYNYLDYFLKENHFPKGAILLRSMRMIFSRKKDEIPEKQKAINNIVKSYPNLNFILIGDAGEYDAEVYMDVVQKFPNRINAIFLRNVNHKKKSQRILKLIENYTEVPFYLINNSEEGIRIAKENNFYK